MTTQQQQQQQGLFREIGRVLETMHAYVASRGLRTEDGLRAVRECAEDVARTTGLRASQVRAWCSDELAALALEVAS